MENMHKKIIFCSVHFNYLKADVQEKVASFL